MKLVAALQGFQSLSGARSLTRNMAPSELLTGGDPLPFLILREVRQTIPPGPGPQSRRYHLSATPADALALRG